MRVLLEHIPLALNLLAQHVLLVPIAKTPLYLLLNACLAHTAVEAKVLAHPAQLATIAVQPFKPCALLECGVHQTLPHALSVILATCVSTCPTLYPIPPLLYVLLVVGVSLAQHAIYVLMAITAIYLVKALNLPHVPRALLDITARFHMGRMLCQPHALQGPIVPQALPHHCRFSALLEHTTQMLALQTSLLALFAPLEITALKAHHI